MEKYVTALNRGMTGSRCISSDHEGDICSMAQREFIQIYLQPGWVGHGPMEIWSSQLGVMVGAVGGIGAHINEAATIGITNQRETIIVWGKQAGTPIYSAVVRRRRRTPGMIEKLRADGMKQLVKEWTGPIPDTYSSRSKIAWILDYVEGVRGWAKREELLSGVVDTWLIWDLTRGAVYVADCTSAPRTMLYNIHKLCWDKRILDYSSIPACVLPEVKPLSCLFGYTSEEMIGRRAPIVGVAGDRQVVLSGQRCFGADEVKNTYGTGCFLLMNTGEKAVVPENGLLTTIVASCDGQVEYALGGSVFVARASIQWLRGELWVIKMAAQLEEYCNSVGDTAGVHIVLAFAGLGAPY